MNETELIFLVAEVIAAAIGFGTAWAMRGREVRKAREAVAYMRGLWLRLDQSPSVARALRDRKPEVASPMRLVRGGLSADKHARA